MVHEECVVCQIISGDVESKKIYEDEEVIAILDFNGANPGHSFIIPKEHIPIFEQIPQNLIGRLFNVANKISSSIFETLKVQGTNIFVTNGISAGQKAAHFIINVIPRKENDGINLGWQPKQLNEEEMSTVELKIKEALSNVGVATAVKSQQPAAVKQEKKEQSNEQQEKVSEEDDYLIRQLRRIP